MSFSKFIEEKLKKAVEAGEFDNNKRLEWFKKGRKSTVNIYYHPGTNNLPLVIIAIFRKHEKLVLEKIVEILIHDKLSQSN